MNTFERILRSKVFFVVMVQVLLRGGYSCLLRLPVQNIHLAGIGHGGPVHHQRDLPRTYTPNVY